jgi:hypothetical protein
MAGEQSMGETRVNKPIDQYIAVLGISGDRLNELLADEQYYDFDLNSIFLDDPEYEERRRLLVKDIDETLELFGLTGGYEVEALIEEQERDVLTTTKQGLRDHLSSGVSIGELFYQMTYNSFPMETEEWGHANAKITFSLGFNRRLTITGNGDFWTERYYRDPKTGKAVQEIEIRDALEEIDEDPEFIDSEIDFHIYFEGRVEQVG